MAEESELRREIARLTDLCADMGRENAKLRGLLERAADYERIRSVHNLLKIYESMSTTPKKPENLDIQRTDLPRDVWINHVYDGLCHYCGQPKNPTEGLNLRMQAQAMAEYHYDEAIKEDGKSRSPADAVWDEVQAGS
jgi:hypothetical protein